MKKLLLFVSLVALSFAIFGVGLFEGYRYTVEKCAPNAYDFSFADGFMSLVGSELDKYQQFYSYGWDIKTTLRGPVLAISTSDSTGPEKKFERKIMIRDDIIEKVLTFQSNSLIDRDIEKVRPLAKEIAEKIIEIQPR